jgi:hypothetical protein
LIFANSDVQGAASRAAEFGLTRSTGDWRTLVANPAMTGEEIVSVYAVSNCQIDPAIGAAGDIDSLMVTMLTASGRMCSCRTAAAGRSATTSASKPTAPTKFSSSTLPRLEAL